MDAPCSQNTIAHGLRRMCLSNPVLRHSFNHNDWTVSQSNLPSHHNDVRGGAICRELTFFSVHRQEKKTGGTNVPTGFNSLKCPINGHCRHASATNVARSLGLYRVSLYAVSSSAVSHRAVLLHAINLNAVAVVSSSSLSLVTARSERDSCESYEHENQFLHCCVSLE